MMVRGHGNGDRVDWIFGSEPATRKQQEKGERARPIHIVGVRVIDSSGQRATCCPAERARVSA